MVVAVAGGVLLLAGESDVGAALLISGLMLAPFIAWMGVLLGAFADTKPKTPSSLPPTTLGNSYFGFVAGLVDKRLETKPRPTKRDADDT
jgi:hypothetical protein